MSAMGRHVFEMEEDAREMNRESFILKYGRYNADVWDSVRDNYMQYAPAYDEYEEYDNAIKKLG